MKTLLAIVLTTVAASAPATPAVAAKPDLVISGGSATADADGAITAQVTVRNKGKRKAGPSSVTISMGSASLAQVVGSNDNVKGVKKKKRRSVSITGQAPADFKPLTYDITACADPNGAVDERNEENNCKVIGQVVIKGQNVPAAPATPAGPVEFNPDEPFMLESGQSMYWTAVPSKYTGAQAVPLFVWMHGCGGNAEDIYNVMATGNQNYIAISIGGRDGGCWDVETDSAKVLAAIANVKTHFKIDPKKVVIGGFSSGGDLAYRTAFSNSTMFAGVLAAMTLPFRDTGMTQAAALAAATNKFHVVHLAGTEDDFYTLDAVRTETDALKAAGFPVERVEKPGGHYDEQTDPNIKAVLLPHMMDGWVSP